MKSMTGFGCGTYADNTMSVTVEIKSVNHRFSEFNIHVPKQFSSFEDPIRKMISPVLHRGKIDVNVLVKELNLSKKNVIVDYGLFEAYKKEIDIISERYFSSTTELKDIIAVSQDWIICREADIDLAKAWQVVETALETALSDILLMRQQEGMHIQKDLLARLTTMETELADIENREAVIVDAYEKRLRAKIENMLKLCGVQVDETRILQEVAIYSDKTNCTEEIVRFYSHMVQLNKLLLSSGDIGRKLDFLVQEINREVNTIGSKANDLAATGHVLEIKNELEKVREQIQNIE